MVNSKCLFENCLIPFLEWFTIYDRYIFRAIIVSIKYKSSPHTVMPFHLQYYCSLSHIPVWRGTWAPRRTTPKPCPSRLPPPPPHAPPTPSTSRSCSTRPGCPPTRRESPAGRGSSSSRTTPSSTSPMWAPRRRGSFPSATWPTSSQKSSSTEFQIGSTKVRG